MKKQWIRALSFWCGLFDNKTECSHAFLGVHSYLHHLYDLHLFWTGKRGIETRRSRFYCIPKQVFVEDTEKQGDRAHLCRHLHCCRLSVLRPHDQALLFKVWYSRYRPFNSVNNSLENKLALNCFENFANSLLLSQAKNSCQDLFLGMVKR